MHHEHPNHTLALILKLFSFPAILLLLCCSTLCSLASAADIAREQRLADNIKDSLIVGEVVTLQADGSEFISLINNEEPDQPRGSVIILHGMGANPNAPQVIYPLRSQLAKLGWVTAGASRRREHR